MFNDGREREPRRGGSWALWTRRRRQTAAGDPSIVTARVAENDGRGACSSPGIAAPTSSAVELQRRCPCRTTGAAANSGAAASTEPTAPAGRLIGAVCAGLVRETLTSPIGIALQVAMVAVVIGLARVDWMAVLSRASRGATGQRGQATPDEVSGAGGQGRADEKPRGEVRPVIQPDLGQ